MLKKKIFSIWACPFTTFRVGVFQASLFASVILFLSVKGSANPYSPLTLTLKPCFHSFKIPPHKFYLSITQIQQTQNSLQVISNIFWDDLEVELSDYFQKKIFITDPNIQNYTQTYFKEYFLLYQNGKKLSFDWIGMEISVDKAEIYFEYPKITSTKNLALNNRIFFRKFPEQKNMTHLITLDKKRYSILHRKDDPLKTWN